MKLKYITSALLTSGIITFLSLGCLQPREPQKCPKGETVQSCNVTTICTCDIPPTVKNGVLLCAVSEQSASDQIALKIRDKVPNVDSVQVECFDTKNDIAPQNENSLSEFQVSPPLDPQDWGDSKCGKCMANKCHNESVACASDSTCHCLDICQMTNPLEDCLPVCDNPPGSSEFVYRPFVNCAWAQCESECIGEFHSSCESCK